MLIDPVVSETELSAMENCNKPGWKAEIQLGFVVRQGKTLLTKRQHHGPLTVQRPFYPEGGLCHVYLLHPPGGVVAGDRLFIDVHVESKAKALITTPGAGKFYRSVGQQAHQANTLQVEEGASLEWLPQETIVYEGARLVSDMTIDLASDARFIGWEIIALGRPAAGEGFSVGEAQLNWRIRRNGVPLFLEKMVLDAQAFTARWGLQGHSVCGTLIACCADMSNLQAVRSLIADEPYRGVTLIEDLLICRASDVKTRQVRDFFENVRAVIRDDVVGQKVTNPRIWVT